MDLSILTVARALDVSENTVRDYIASGKLRAERKGQHLFISESALRAFMDAEEKAAEEETSAAAVEQSEPVAPSREMLQPIMYRLLALQKQFEEKMDLLKENQRLSEELKQRERELLLKGYEIEKLEHDLIYQKRLQDKELENHQIILEEKWAVLQKEASERIAQERKHIDEMLAMQERRWVEKLAEEKELLARQMAEAGRREGLWSRLIKMMTWS